MENGGGITRPNKIIENPQTHESNTTRKTWLKMTQHVFAVCFKCHAPCAVFLSARPVNLRIWCPQKTHDVEDLQSGPLHPNSVSAVPPLPEEGIKRHLQKPESTVYTPFWFSVILRYIQYNQNNHPCSLVPWIHSYEFKDWWKLLNLLACIVGLPAVQTSSTGPRKLSQVPPGWPK